MGLVFVAKVVSVDDVRARLAKDLDQVLYQVGRRALFHPMARVSQESAGVVPTYSSRLQLFFSPNPCLLRLLRRVPFSTGGRDTICHHNPSEGARTRLKAFYNAVSGQDLKIVLVRTDPQMGGGVQIDTMDPFVWKVEPCLRMTQPHRKPRTPSLSNGGPR